MPEEQAKGAARDALTIALQLIGASLVLLVVIGALGFVLREPLEQLRSALAKVYADKAPSLTLGVARELAYPIDAADFLELAGNLMDNACKYGRAAVAVRATPWTAAAWRRPGLVLEVEDDGRGIPYAERARVLERGARADESVAGQGIGLAVAREIAAAYGGTLEIGESRLGGAHLTVRLPGR